MADKNPTESQLERAVQQMIDSGSSREEIAKFVQQYDDLSHPIRAVLGGAQEGVTAGIVDGIMALPRLAKGVVSDAIDMLQGNDPKEAKAFLDQISDWLPQYQQAGAREKTKMITELMTTLGSGAVTGKLMRGPGMRGAGATLVRASEHPLAMRLATGGTMVGGILHGNPEAVAAGAAGMVLPDVAEGMGQTMYRIGTGAKPALTSEAPFVKLIGGRNYITPKAGAKLESQFDTALSRKGARIAAQEDRLSDSFDTNMAKRDEAFRAEQDTAKEEQSQKDAVNRFMQGHDLTEEQALGKTATVKDPNTGETVRLQTRYVPKDKQGKSPTARAEASKTVVEEAAELAKRRDAGDFTREAQAAKAKGEPAPAPGIRAKTADWQAQENARHPDVETTPKPGETATDATSTPPPDTAEVAAPKPEETSKVTGKPRAKAKPKTAGPRVKANTPPEAPSTPPAGLQAFMTGQPVEMGAAARLKLDTLVKETGKSAVDLLKDPDIVKALKSEDAAAASAAKDTAMMDRGKPTHE